MKESKIQHRIGEVRTMNNGLLATIIAYRSSKDIDVQFEDEQIRKNVCYDNFLKGCVAHPQSKHIKASTHIGETRTMNNGMEATIIDCRSCSDMTVQFKDGQIRKEITYNAFLDGRVAHSERFPINPVRAKNAALRIGNTRTMNNSLKATIISYRSHVDIDVQFEDGQIRKGVAYGNFLKGTIAHPCSAHLRNKTESRIGETRMMNCGMKATILTYRSRHDVDIQFEDGKIRENVAYSAFLKGAIAHTRNAKLFPRNAKVFRVGETRTMNNGLCATIMAYRSCKDIDIRFEDGTIREHIEYGVFTKGQVARPTKGN